MRGERKGRACLSGSLFSYKMHCFFGRYGNMPAVLTSTHRPGFSGVGVLFAHIGQ